MNPVRSASDRTRKCPAPGAALGATRNENADNLEGKFVSGVKAKDGYVWVRVGN